MAVQEHSVQDWFVEAMMAGVPERHQQSANAIRLSLLTASETIRRRMPPGPEQSRAITELRTVLDIVRRGLIASKQ